MKKKRIVDSELKSSFYHKPCIVCGKRRCDPAHIQSKGSGGDDASWNLMALCREHHTEQHAIGIFTFIERYPQVELHLLMLGWEINHTYRKLFRPKN